MIKSVAIKFLFSDKKRMKSFDYCQAFSGVGKCSAQAIIRDVNFKDLSVN